MTEAALAADVISRLADERALEPEQIKPADRLLEDLGMDGDDAVEFFIAFEERYASAGARKAQRVAAWSMVISGLIYTVAFAIAPLDLAVLIGCGAVLIAMGLTFGYCLSLRARSTAA